MRGSRTAPCDARCRGRASFLPSRAASRLALERPAAVAAEVEPVLLQGLLDLLDRLLAEVRDRGELVLRLHHEVTDRLDADALQAVVRADTELELLDREVLHPVQVRCAFRRRALAREPRALRHQIDVLEIREDPERRAQVLGFL